VLQYTEIEIKVRNATNNDKWGVSSSSMADIARATNDYQEYPQLFAMLWKRLNDVEHVMHVYKALILVEYLLRNGAERFLNDAKKRVRDISQLTKYKHYDDNNRDDAVEARNKAKQIYQLLTDEQRLKEERQKAVKIKDVKMSGFGSNDYGVDEPAASNPRHNQSNNEFNVDYDENKHNSDEEATEKPKKKKAGKSDSSAANSAPDAQNNAAEATAEKKKKKKKKPVEQGEGQSSTPAAELQSSSNKPARYENTLSSADQLFSFDATRDPFAANGSNIHADDPFSVPGFQTKSSAADSAPGPVPVSIPNRLGSVSKTVNQANIAAVPAENTGEKKKKKKNKDASAGSNSATAAYTAAAAAVDPFSSAPSYDLTAFSGPSYINPSGGGNNNIDILTGLHATAHQGGDLADVFAAATLSDINNQDPFTKQFSNQPTHSNAMPSSHNNLVSSHTVPTKSGDLWDMANSLANIDNLSAAPAAKKSPAAQGHNEVSMSMMRSMQPLGTSAHALQQQEMRQSSVPKSNIMPTPVANYGYPANPMYAPPAHMYAAAAAPQQPMLMLMAPGATALPPSGVYAPNVANPYYHQAAGVPANLDPFSSSVSPTNGFGRRAPQATYNSKTPIIFEPVPAKRQDNNNITNNQQINAQPSGPNWNRY
jgi:hypothetical protein